MDVEMVNPNFVENFIERVFIERELKEGTCLEQTICRNNQKQNRTEHFQNLIQKEIKLIDQKVNQSTIFLICFG